MAACVSNIICITQITFKFINNALLVNYGRLQFRFSQVINDLLARKDWLQFMIEKLQKNWTLGYFLSVLNCFGLLSNPAAQRVSELLEIFKFLELFSEGLF